MALSSPPKAPGDTLRFSWTPDLADDDSVASFAAPTASGATIDAYAIEDDNLIVSISGGVAGTTATISLSGTSSWGETLTETVYLPIIATTATTPTAREVVNFALRKITGLGEDPNAEQEADALETLNDMLALWAASGLDLGVTHPLTASTVVAVPDAYLSAIKYNLRVACHNFYGAEITPMDMQLADASKRAASNLLTTFEDVKFSATLAPTINQVASLF